MAPRVERSSDRRCPSPIPSGKFTISGEIWHFSQAFEKGNTVGNLWAVSRALRKNLVVDAGFNRGLTETSTRWEAFVGLTYLLPHRLWMVRPGFQPSVTFAMPC
jgi:hypothetical protein